MSYRRINDQDRMIESQIAAFPGVKNTETVKDILIGKLPRSIDGKLAPHVGPKEVRAALSRMMKSAPWLFTIQEKPLTPTERIRSMDFAELTSDFERSVWRAYNGEPK